jgi:hypothetical protein
MKLTVTATIDVEKDWDDSLFDDGGEGRRRVITSLFRRAMTSAMMTHAARITIANGVEINSLSVSDPVWEESDTPIS